MREVPRKRKEGGIREIRVPERGESAKDKKRDPAGIKKDEAP